ncbi:hypothetical protein COUCH_17115 [Couchioplanes caeruleus]|uniref:hypothetical protein n=1 Tax=Couchioplanes caeruleus TaxID=56438 RepID=UPI0020BE7765|nr:hypothetical protein [Couchioplanes caeruleus]UQU67889.1 hypothetical protein COUCH_17115 [Couchioplanes caeruleus]
MSRIGRFLATPFGLAVLACLALAGWALWSGGVLDGTVARDVRTSSVYAAPGTGLDEAAAERVVGNRRLVVLLLEPGADLRQGCDRVRHAADGTLVLVLARDGDEYEQYGCALLPGVGDENFGRAFVAETTIGRGVDQFPDRPLDALKVVVVNYDTLVRSGTVPDGARTISPSLPRYLVAAAAVLAVLLGSAVVFAAGRRAGRLAADRRSRLAEAGDARTALSAAAAVLAQQIIDLDARDHESGAFRRRFRRLVSDYTALLDELAAADERTAGSLTERVEALSARARRLAVP